MTQVIVRLIGNSSSLISAEWKTSHLPYQSLISISVFAETNKTTQKQVKVHILSSFSSVSDTCKTKGVLNIDNYVISKRNSHFFSHVLLTSINPGCSAAQ